MEKDKIRKSKIEFSNDFVFNHEIYKSGIYHGKIETETKSGGLKFIPDNNDNWIYYTQVPDEIRKLLSGYMYINNDTNREQKIVII
jgi:hypothetical protein